MEPGASRGRRYTRRPANMKSARSLLSIPVLFALCACGTISDWREARSAPMTFGDCFDGLIAIANTSGFTADVSACDRGNGLWQSRWRTRQLERFGYGRYRLRAEVLIDEGSAKTGWPIRYVVEQQRVKDLRNTLDPAEGDWSNDGQDRETEAVFGEKLVRRLCPKV